MVLGLRSKHKRGASVRVQYIVHIEEIRPWPPSESLKSVQTVLIQWENGDQNSGSFISVAGESNIVFNESFMLPITLHQDKKASDKFKKNYLEFSLFEPRKDKAKGQLLGTASLNLADYGVMDHVLNINVPLSFKKSSSTSVQPGLIISFDPVERDSSNSSPKVGFLEYDDNSSEVASFTDDDASSHSSRAAGSSTIDSLTTSPSHNEKNAYGNGGVDSLKEQNKNLRPSSNDSLFDARNHVNDQVSLSKFSERSLTSVKNSVSPSIRSSPSSISFREIHTKPNNTATSFARGSVYHPNSHEVIASSNYKSSRNIQQYVEDKSFERFSLEAVEADNYGKSSSSQNRELQPDDVLIDNLRVGERLRKDIRWDEQILEGTNHSTGNKLLDRLSDDNMKRQVTTRSDTLAPNRKAPLVPPSSSNKPQLKHAKSVQIHGTAKGNGLLADFYAGGKAPDLDTYNVYHKKGRLSAKIEGKEQNGEHFDSKNEWKTRVEMLEEELKESAAIEVGLYSVVAEHASSGNKVHAPARRLSRFYSNICEEGSQAKRSNAARAAVSGLVLVSKSCGNDVPRLTYWLSNSIMLRAIVSQIAAELPHSNVSRVKHDGPTTTSASAGRIKNKQLDSSHMDEYAKPTEEFDDFEDVLTFIMALEKVESWLFSRIVESVWWQTFTPHMQPSLAKDSERINNTSGMKKSNGRRNNIGGNNEQGNLSIELWKKAFKDACERLCPIRAGGHECGCLSVLVRLVMEQLVNRLDVAMFNAILRESAEEMPTDPFSDPISDSKVLPIPAGKSSFGAGAQLKNAIGYWSRWLTDLFGLEDESYEDTNILGDGNRPKSFKAFKLLHTLSNLMMLPFGMLADASTRKEVCPTFGPALIKRVLNNFVPDEFCPDPMPHNIIAALDSEDTSDCHNDMVTFFPCTATPTKYSPPAAALLTCVGEVGSQVLQSSRLSTLKKSYASDDELDELDSPLTSIVPDSFLTSSALAKLSLMPKEKGGRNVVRYQLLREIWKDVE